MVICMTSRAVSVTSYRSSLSTCFFFFFTDTATPESYTRPYTLSLHDALPISPARDRPGDRRLRPQLRRLRAGAGAPAQPRSEEHTSELQSHGLISYAVFC